MTTKYRIYGEVRTAAEARRFIDDYLAAIRRPRSRYAEMLSFIPAQTHVLDYGCGWGTFARMMYEHGCTVDGIDIDADSIAIARDVVGEEDGLTFSMQGIYTVADAIYDGVTSVQVLEHTHNPGNYLQQCNRVLKPGGHLIISVPNIMNPRYFLAALARRRQQSFQRIDNEIKNDHNKVHDHVQAWDPTTFCRLLCSMGFRYIDHRFTEGVALPFSKYWHTRLPGIRNWSYTMIFKMQKDRYVEIANDG